MRQTELSLSKRERRIVDAFRSKGLHRAREFNRAHILAALDSKVPERQNNFTASIRTNCAGTVGRDL